MERETHIYLADKIHERLVLDFPMAFSRDLFRIANVEPDQLCQSILHPHFANWSFAYIENQIALLAEERLCIGDSIQKDFVVRLGRITHYLCDFFCQVHIGSRLLRVREHVAYEGCLNQVIQEQPRYFDRICRSASPPAAQPALSIRRLYDHCLHQYLQQPVGFERDMKAATWISVQLAGSIMQQCLNNAGAVSLRLSSISAYL
ncbi:MAG: zinc dependent phospholipase C family protein [Bacillota bacterium]|nr:zinc dependent phospholipase C family protein [Bacillota bacterium]